MIADVRLAFRMLAKYPASSAVAIISLALGVAVNVVMFSVINAVLLRPLPVAEPERLLRIGATVNGAGFIGLTHPEFISLRDGLEAFDGIVAYRFNGVVLNATGVAREQAAELVTHDYFSFLGVTPVLGRGFAPEEGDPGAAPIAVISHRLWKRQFGRDPEVVGRVVSVGGQPATVIGVAPPGFDGTFPGVASQLWIPLWHNDRLLPGRGTLATDRFLLVLGRLRHGVTHAEALAELQVAAAAVLPSAAAGSRWSLAIEDTSGVIPMIANVARPFLMMLMGAVVLVLTIACANVAGLLVARGEERHLEMAVRGAIGASRARLVGQLLIEGLVLATLGGVCGVLLSVVGLGLVGRYQPSIGGSPIQLDAGLDTRVLLFSLGVTVATGILFGLTPALRASKVDLVSAMKTAAAGGRSGSWLRSGLVVAQVALSTILLVGSGLLVRSLLSGGRVDPGFDPNGVMIVSMMPHLVGYDETATRALWSDLQSRLQDAPGVDDIAWGRYVPLGGQSDRVSVVLPGTAGPDTRPPRINYNVIDPQYFPLLRMTLARGRNFTGGDRMGSPPVTIVNETLAARLGGPARAIDQSLRVWDREGIERVVQVVGVVGDTKYRRLSEGPTPWLFFPQAQWFTPELHLYVRTSGDEGATTAAVIDAVRNLDRELPVVIDPMTARMAYALIPARIAGVVIGVAGILALILAATGLFAVVSYAAIRRLREIGIRMALGAPAVTIGRLVLGHGLRFTAVGLAVGGLGALVVGRVLRGLLIGIGPSDPLTFGGTAGLLAVVSIVAGFLPARRAMQADPVRVLRSE